MILKEYLYNNYPQNKAEEFLNKFDIYSKYLIEENQKYNLTAITEQEEIELKHYIDSLSALNYISGSVADIGSGAGFPGLVLKIIKSENEFTLIDSLNKRVNFLNSLINKLQLDNVKAIHCRAEDLPKTKKYDTIVSRAVSRLNTLSEYCIPFVKKGGLFIAYKADDCEQEIKEAEFAIRLLGGKIENVVNVKLYNSDIVRKLVLIRKINDTPLSFPRLNNKPKKQPLVLVR